MNTFIFVAAAILAVAGNAATTTSSAQEYFESPAAAVDAFMSACEANSTEQLVQIFGPVYKAEAERISDAEERVNRAKIASMAGEVKRIEQCSPDKAVLVLGNQLWPFPIPIVREPQGWRFDTETGFDEMIKRRIGRNELTAIDVCRTYVEAQNEYAMEDRDGDGVLEFAQKIRSTDGQMDGLYWAADTDEQLSPLGPLIAEVESAPGSPQSEGYMGYRYKILTAQGKYAPGGKESYIDGNNMTKGFALVAWPVDYGHSGIMTFIVNDLGAVYQKDLGPKSATIAQKMVRFNPDPSWKLVTD